MFTTTPLSSGSMTGRSIAVRKVPGVSTRTRRPKMISTFSGRPRSRLSAISASKNQSYAIELEFVNIHSPCMRDPVQPKAGLPEGGGEALPRYVGDAEHHAGAVPGVA